jgi:hypothetical protein
MLLSSPAILPAQKMARVKNVGIGVEQNKAIINYELRSSREGSRHSVQLKFLDKHYNMISPHSLTGDVGANIFSGPDKTIQWDLSRDYDLFGSDITPVIFVDGISRQFNKPGGPGNAVYSLLMPGLGDYFVADHRMMRFKPYLRTLSSLGLIGLGIYAGEQRWQQEGEWVSVLKADHWRFTGDDRFRMVYYEGEMQYWLFKGDKEVFIAMGAVIWAYDFIWVLVRGSNNKKFLRELSNDTDISISYYDGAFQMKYALSF